MRKFLILCSLFVTVQMFGTSGETINAKYRNQNDFVQDVASSEMQPQKAKCGAPKKGNCRTGATGATGATGSRGPKGARGKQGEKGCQGPKGEQGCKGKRGEQGPRGCQGVAGNDGESGLNGLNGLNGIQGPPGPSISVIADAAFSGATAQVVASGASVVFNTSVGNYGDEITFAPAIPLTTVFELPAGPSLFLVTYGISLYPLAVSVAPGSFALNLTDPPLVPTPTGVAGGALGLYVSQVLSSVTTLVSTTGAFPTLSVTNVGTQAQTIGMLNGEVGAYITIIQLQ